MKNSKNQLTKEGYEFLVNELKELTTIKNTSLADALREAGELGDLRENSEFDAARDQEHRINARIKIIEGTLKNAEIVEYKDSNKVSVGSIVELEFIEDSEIVKLKIVGPLESKSIKNSISYLSPLGSAILNKHVGNEVCVESPNGDYRVKIISIS